MTISAVFGTSTMTMVSLVAHDQAAVGGRFIHGHAGLPVRAELGRNAEPAHPVAAHGRRSGGRNVGSGIRSTGVVVASASSRATCSRQRRLWHGPMPARVRRLI